MCAATAQGLRAALEIVCILALVGSRSPLLAGCLVLASPLAAPAIKALSGAIQSASRDAQLAAATTASAADEVSIGLWCVRRATGHPCCRPAKTGPFEASMMARSVAPPCTTLGWSVASLPSISQEGMSDNRSCLLNEDRLFRTISLA